MQYKINWFKLLVWLGVITLGLLFWFVVAVGAFALLIGGGLFG